ncbi:aminotransferase class V-fold PLP-dependent enzyme, partial [Streptococcus sobrinus]
MTKDYSFETLQLHAGQPIDSDTKSRAVPIYQTTSYIFDDAQAAEDIFALRQPANIYSRITNPTVAVFEERMAALEKGVGAVATASGMAAITYSILALAHTGDHVVAATTLYGGTFNLLKETLPRYGITTSFVNVDNLEKVAGALQDNTKLVLIETLGNPLINIPDIEAVAKIAHDHKVPLVIDNTFATPYLINVFDHGADIAVHSATKFIGGHGTSIGGVIVDSGRFDWEASGKFPQFVDEDPSYHNLSYTRDVG